jgi:hypothetical protein
VKASLRKERRRDNFPFMEQRLSISNEGDNYETNKIKEDKYGGNIIKNKKI